MNKKIVIILLIILLVVIGYFAICKINENKRNYDIEEISEYKYFVYKEEQKYGVIDKQGKIILNAIYDRVEIPNPSKDVFICYENSKGSAFNSNKQQIFSEYNSVTTIQLKNAATNPPYEKSTLKTEKNGKYGLIDFTGKVILNTEYENIDNFSNIEGKIQITQNGKIGVANIKGTILVKPNYDAILGDNYYNEETKYKDGGYIVGEKSDSGYKYGYIDNKGKQKLKLEYNDISRITDIPNKDEVYLIAAKNGQYGVIKNNKNIINNEYQDIDYEKTNNVLVLQKNKRFGVANLSGNIVIPVENTNVEAKGNYLYIEKNNIRGVYDSEGNKVNLDFDKTIMSTSNDNYNITITSKENGNYYGVVAANNKQIIKSEYLYIEYAFDNYFIVCGQNGKLGVLDNNEQEVMELKYDLVQKVQGKNIIQALYSDTNITEIYSNNMKKICEMQNATVESQAEYIKVYSDKELKFFNNNGEETSNAKLFPNNKIYAASQDGLWGYVDANGSVKVKFEYEMTNDLNEYGYAAIKKDGKWGAIDSNGQIIVEPKYEINENFGKVEFLGEFVKVSNGFGDSYYTKDM